MRPARELAGLEPEEQREVWDRAIALGLPHGKNVDQAAWMRPSGLTGDQLEFLTRRQPPWPIPLADKWETAEQRFARVMPLWRRSTFVNCWSKLEHESHALWRIYCKSVEGVAVQTTLSKLVDSVGGLTVCAVTHGNPGKTKRTPGILDVVTKKQPWYDYEQEVRVVRSDDPRTEASSEESVGDESLAEPAWSWPGVGSRNQSRINPSSSRRR